MRIGWLLAVDNHTEPGSVGTVEPLELVLAESDVEIIVRIFPHDIVFEIGDDHALD